MSDELDKAIKKRVESIFPHPATASAVVDLIVHKKPRGWGRKSCAPYYKEMYAKQVKEDIDKMIENKQRLVYEYKIWCDEETGGMSPNTLYQRINQSIRYLVEEMDTEDRNYAKWYETVRVEREAGVGVVIAFIAGMAQDDFHAVLAEPKESIPLWKRRLDTWIESDDVEPFVQENLALNPEEIHLLKAEIAGLTNIMSSITSRSVKLVKIS